MNEYLTETPVASVIFALTIISSLFAFSNPELNGKLMLHPYSIHRGRRIYTIITSGFIHLDFGHLIMNMISYYCFAFFLERLIGHWQFGLLYIGSMALSDISTIIKYKDYFGYNSLGASGAISAVLFSFVLFYPQQSLYLFLIPIPIPAVVFAFLYLIYSAYASRKSSHINHDAHFYGALSGLIITIIYYPQVIGHFVNQVNQMLPF
jgi:membrane associated rhomboid family serine protease